MRIAVLDNDPSRAEPVSQTLAAAGHVCHKFVDGNELFKQLRRQTFDLLVLDWDISAPGGGQEVLHRVRQGPSARLPVLFVTNRRREVDIALLLDNCTVDYVVKPISASVLLARVGLLLRRAYQLYAPMHKEVFGECEFDLKSRRVSIGGKQVALTQKEFELARLLFRHLSQPLSRAHILDLIWEQSDNITSRSMDTHISMLRSKLGLRPERGYRLAPIYGYGYRLERLDEGAV